MSWMGWTVIGILGINVIFFGILSICFFIDERRRRR